MWQRSKEEEKKAAEDAAKKPTQIVTDEIKEEDQEHSDDSEEESQMKLDESALDSSFAGSQRGETFIGEGDDTEDTFMPLDQALEQEFDINKVSKLDQRLKDVNR